MRMATVLEVTTCRGDNAETHLVSLDHSEGQTCDRAFLSIEQLGEPDIVRNQGSHKPSGAAGFCYTV